MLPTGSPIDMRIILPVVFKLKTMMGSLLSRHMAIEVASITPRALRQYFQVGDFGETSPHRGT